MLTLAERTNSGIPLACQSTSSRDSILCFCLLANGRIGREAQPHIYACHFIKVELASWHVTGHVKTWTNKVKPSRPEGPWRLVLSILITMLTWHWRFDAWKCCCDVWWQDHQCLYQEAASLSHTWERWRRWTAAIRRWCGSRTSTWLILAFTLDQRHRRLQSAASMALWTHAKISIILNRWFMISIVVTHTVDSLQTL